MPANKYLVPDRNKILKGKLDKIVKSIQGPLGTASLQTKEQYVFETVKALTTMYKSLQEPRLEEEEINLIRVDEVANPEIYNLIWQEVLDDLEIIFTELENLEDLTVANFNFVTTETNRLTSRLKAVSSKLGDYILYSLNPSKDAFFYKDSFNDLSKIDVNSPLLNGDQCEINQAEGIITLPINRDEQSFIVVKENPIINPDSNGIIGNNQELGAAYNGNIAVLLDNNPDTWFEYERVVTVIGDDKEPLVLDLTINLGEEKVINHIRVNPNNFGTKTVIQIDEIETSLDGQVYTSIKDDIPIAGFTTEDEENIFSLAPSTSKYAGQGLYTFTPRKVKYVHLVMRQTEPFTIDTPSGQRLRYAIGLRDINIHGFVYISEGEMVSEPFQSASEIRKVLLDTNQNPSSESELTSIEYSVSADDGATWHRIQPKDFGEVSGIETIPEVLNFNSGDEGAIFTPVPVKSLRLKAKLIRNDDVFEDGSSSFRKTIVTKAELHQVPQSSPFTVELEEPPVKDTIVIVDPLFGSRGKPEAPYILGHATDRIDNRQYRLPFTYLPRPMKKVWTGSQFDLVPVDTNEWVHVSVGGEEWDQATQSLDSYTIDFQNLQDYKKFHLDVDRAILEFGDGLTNTLAPGDNQPVTLWFDAERIYPDATEGSHKAQLDFATSSSKGDMVIKRYDLIRERTQILPRKASIIRLDRQNIVDFTNISTVLGNAGYSDVGFVNGKDEFTTGSQFSLDLEEGTIYLSVPTPATTELSVTYTYQPIYELAEGEWEWATESLLRDSVSIKDSVWLTIPVEGAQLLPHPLASGTRVIDLEHMSVVKGTFSATLEGTIDDDKNPFFKEVDFVNGVEELGGEFVQTTEDIPTDLVPVANVASFDLNQNISTKTSEHKVSFSNTTLFDELVDSEALVNGSGKYYIERDSAEGDYGRVYFHTTTTQETPGTITYYYAGPGYSNSGLFSVDYQNGRIHLQREIDPDNEGDWTLFVDYQYTDFRAEYKIARLLDSDTYDIDITRQTVTFKDSEILKFLQIPHSGILNISPYYLINYDYVAETRENITELQTRFSPVIKDYALRVLTKGTVF